MKSLGLVGKLGLGLVGKLGETLKMQKLWIAEVEGSKAGAAVAEASKKSRLRECFSHVSTLLTCCIY